jgi:hypothetical protein
VAGEAWRFLRGFCRGAWIGGAMVSYETQRRRDGLTEAQRSGECVISIPLSRYFANCERLPAGVWTTTSDSYGNFLSLDGHLLRRLL